MTNDHHFYLRKADLELEIAKSSRSVRPPSALWPGEAAERVAALADDPELFSALTGWAPLCKRLGGETTVRALVELIWAGEVFVFGRSSFGLGVLRPQQQPSSPPRRPPLPGPKLDLVSPLVDIVPPFVLVPRTAAPARRRVVLRTDGAFDGTGVLTCSSDKLQFYRSKTGGAALDLAGADATFPGDVLTAGVTLFVEASSPSAAVDDIDVRLRLQGGSRARGSDAVEPVTAVLLALEVWSDPRTIGGSAPLSAEQQRAARWLHVRHDDWDNEQVGQRGLLDRLGHPRARVVVRPPEPKDFRGEVVLRRKGGSIALHDFESVNVHGDLVSNPATIESQGRTLWAEGDSVGATLLELGLAGVSDVGDSATFEVVRVRFGESERQSYGYDDMRNEEGRIDPRVLHHVCVKSGGSTLVRVELEGNSEGVFFTTDAPIATVPRSLPSAGELEFPIDGAGGLRSERTLLTARLGGPEGPKVAALVLHVYREHVVKVTLVRIQDPNSPDTTLAANPIDRAAIEAAINEVYRTAVARLELHLHNKGAPISVAYDGDKTGALDRPVDGIGEEAWFQTLGSLGSAVAVIVQRVGYFHPLALPASHGDSTLTLRGIDTLPLMPRAGAPERLFLLHAFQLDKKLQRDNLEELEVVAVAGNVATLAAPLQRDYPVGSRAYRGVAGHAGSPVVLREREDEQFPLVLGHEFGHELRLSDVNARDNMMGPGIGSASMRPLRFRALDTFYQGEGPLTESQWDTIPR